VDSPRLALSTVRPADCSTTPGLLTTNRWLQSFYQHPPREDEGTTRCRFCCIHPLDTQCMCLCSADGPPTPHRQQQAWHEPARCCLQVHMPLSHHHHTAVHGMYTAVCSPRLHWKLPAPLPAAVPATLCRSTQQQHPLVIAAHTPCQTLILWISTLRPLPLCPRLMHQCVSDCQNKLPVPTWPLQSLA
jgi:hypothetical protein